MSKLRLIWKVDEILSNSNFLTQTASYRYKSVGGIFFTTGFTPDNPLAREVNDILTPELVSNKTVEFKVETNCTSNGPSINDNGIQEGISFGCINPTISKTDTTSTIVVDLSNTDITKIRFTLRKASDNNIVGSRVVSVRSANSATDTKIGLTGNTNYYWQVEMFATINNIEVSSLSPDYLGDVCSPYPFKTTNTPTCDPITSIVVSSIEIAE